MATIKRTISDRNGKFLRSNFITHCSQASAAGSFQAKMKDSLILAKEVVQRLRLLSVRMVMFIDLRKCDD